MLQRVDQNSIFICGLAIISLYIQSLTLGWGSEEQRYGMCLLLSSLSHSGRNFLRFGFERHMRKPNSIHTSKPRLVISLASENIDLSICLTSGFLKVGAKLMSEDRVRSIISP